MVSQTNHQNFPQKIDTVIDQLEAIRKLLEKDNVPNPVLKTLNLQGVIEFMSAQGINVSPSCMYKLTSTSAIPFKKFGRRLLFDRDEIMQWSKSKMAAINAEKEVVTNLAETANKKGKANHGK